MNEKYSLTTQNEYFFSLQKFFMCNILGSETIPSLVFKLRMTVIITLLTFTLLVQLERRKSL